MGDHCDEALDRLYEFIDQELPPEDLARIGEHLHDCPPCEAEQRINEKIKALVGCCPMEVAPGELRQRILALIESEREKAQ